MGLSNTLRFYLTYIIIYTFFAIWLLCYANITQPLENLSGGSSDTPLVLPPEPPQLSGVSTVTSADTPLVRPPEARQLFVPLEVAALFNFFIIHYSVNSPIPQLTKRCLKNLF